VRVRGHELDFFWPPQRFAVEVGGYAAHAGRAAYERDHRRTQELAAYGIRVSGGTWRGLTAEPEAGRRSRRRHARGRHYPPVSVHRVIVLLVLVALAGCGAAASSAGDFEGEEARVAETVQDVQEAGTADEAQEVCDELFARALAQRFQAGGGGDCRQEVGTAFDDADEFELTVQDVTIQGTTARARVEGDGGTRTLTLVREGGRWRVSELG